MAIPI